MSLSLDAGGRARSHMPGLKADPRLQIVALADPRTESAQTLNTDYALNATVYADHNDLLAREKPDVLVVTLWTHLHLPVIRDAIDAGVRAILCEKPMAATWGECVEIARLAEESQVQLTFCHQRRFASGNRAVRALIAAGRFGKVERMDLASPPHLLDCGTHSMDQAMSFNEESPVTWVQGAVDISDTIQYFNVRAEIMASGVLRFANGVFGTIRVGNTEMDMWGGVRVIGSDGFVEVHWEGDVRRVVVYSDPSWTFPVVESVPDEQMIDMVKNAIDCLETGAEPDTSYQKALRAGEPLFALYESARIHARVTLPLEGVTGNPLFDLLDNGSPYTAQKKVNV